MQIAEVGHVYKILNALHKAGYQGYVVGGAVRDMLLGRVPSDYDIATDARTAETVAVAQQHGWKVIDRLGQNFGVVMLVVDNYTIEVATFRGERYGSDSHRPAEVWYATTLIEDLARRDFTVNAMALDLDGTLIDPFEGQRDLRGGVIRAVGEPERRFAEDALRMFRACRFAAQLGFELDVNTFNAIKPNLARVAGLSLERVRIELEKMLLSSFPERGFQYLLQTGLAGAACRVKEKGSYNEISILPELVHLLALPQSPLYHRYDAWQHTLEVVKVVPAELVLRWAALLHDVGKGLPGIRAVNKQGFPSDHGHEVKSEELAQNILTRFRLPKEVVKRVSWLVRQHMRFGFLRDSSDDACYRWVRREARSGLFRSTRELVEGYKQLGLLGIADITGTGAQAEIISAARHFAERLTIMAQQMPVSTSDLIYDAVEIMNMLGELRHMGPFLKNVLERVQNGQLENTKECIATAALKWVKRKEAKMNL